jgi:rod shape-determining protein MreC
VETFLNRYRNLTVLLLVIFAQLVLLAVQVKNDQDVRMIRIWTVTAVTPAARVVEWLRGGSTGILHDYVLLHDTHDQNRRLQKELDRLKLENIFLKNELNTADRAKALAVFQERTPSKTMAANVIGTGAGANAKVVFVDRGSVSGVQRGMAVVTPDGIVGKVTAAYPTASEVLLITDSDFAAGVISQKNQVRGTLKGQGSPVCKVDYVPIGEKVAVGDWFYTSGDDRIFPRGFPVGIVKSVRDGSPFQEVYLEPSGLQRGLEDVLILTEGVHQAIPDQPVANQPVYIAPALPAADQAAVQPLAGTQADQLRAQYKAIGEAQKHTFGEGPPGTKPPDFTKMAPLGSPTPAPAAGAATTPAPPGQAPSGQTTGGTATRSVPSTPAQPRPAVAPPSAPPQPATGASPPVKTSPPKSPPPDDPAAERPRVE